MNRINNNKRRVLRQLLNNKREDAGQTAFKTIRGYNKLYGTTTNETYRIMDDLLGVVVRDVVNEETLISGGFTEDAEVHDNKGENMEQLEELYKSVRGTTRHFLYIVGDKVIIDRVVDVPNFPDNQDFKDWFSGEKWYWMKDSEFTKFEDEGYAGKVYSYPLGENITPQRIIQSYLDGDVHCVLSVVRKRFDADIAREDLSVDRKKKLKGKLKHLSKFEEQYKDGIPEDKMEEVALKLNSKLYVRSLFSYDTKCYGEQLKDSLLSFHFTNTRADHVDLGFLIKDQKPEPVSRDFLLNFIDECDEKKIFYYYEKTDGISAVYTMNEAYALTSKLLEAKGELETQHGMYNMKIDELKFPELSSFISRGTHFNTSMKFNNIPSKLLNIDQKKAYANFHDCKYYEGFLGKITDFRKTDKIIGVGLYLIKDLKPFNCYTQSRKNFIKLNDAMNMYKSNNVYTSAELKFLTDMGWTYKIIAGCWGLEPFDFEFNDVLLDGKYDSKPFVNADGELKMKGASYYAVVCGMWASDHKYKYRYIRGDEKTYHMLCQSNCGEIYKFNGDDEITIRTRKQEVKTLTHITSFILAYQRLSLIEQLQEMEFEKLDSIYVDGIYYYEHDFKMLDTFKVGNCESYSQLSFSQKFITKVFETKPVIQYANARPHHPTELWTGAGGCGKTHFNLTDHGLVNMLFASPTHKLNANKKTEYDCDVITHAGLVSENPNNPAYTYNVLLIDEVSMLSNENKEIILTKFKNMKIIMCGDVGFQLPCVNGTPFKIEGFIYYKHLTENYRVIPNDPLIDLLGAVRDCIEHKTPFRLDIPTVDEEYLIANYKIQDMILTYTRSKRDYYTKIFANLKKWYVEKSDVHHHGDILIQDEKPYGKDVQIRHGFTTHSIQGETCKHTIYIHMEVIHSDPTKRLLYTALSRAKSIKQIKFIV